MARADTIDDITAQLAARVADLATARDDNPTTARASVAHESAIIAVWSLQFQLAQLRLLDAEGEQQIELHKQAVAASKEIAEHEKRLRVAVKSTIDDAEIEAAERKRGQDALAGKLRLLAGR